MDLTAEQIIKNLNELKRSRADFDNIYQTLKNFFYVESGNITRHKNPGSELHTLLDSTSLDSGDVLSSGLLNYLTPEASKWLYLEHADPRMKDEKEIKDWMSDAADEVLLTLSRSNFYNQMPIFYKSSGIYGTAAMFCEEDETDNVRFYNLPIKNLYLTEDARERPHEFYLEFEYTALEAVSRFKDKVSEKVKEAYQNHRDNDKKFIYICYIGERDFFNPHKRDKKNMPVKMLWIEKETKTIVKEDGFRSMPCVAHRFYKQAGTPYGYSPAMKALPAVRMVNTIADTVIRSAMKQTDPAIALPDDAFIGIPNFNPRQINFYERGKLSPKDDIIPLGAYGNINVGLNELAYYQNQIKSLMFYDTFQAFASLTKQMTVPEVMERISEKMTLLGPAVGRFMNDVLSPLVEKTLLILFNKGRLPPLPDLMQENPSYSVKFVGRLVQSQRQSEVNNILNALGIAGEIAQFKPEVLDNIDPDKILKEVFAITGVNTNLLADDEIVENIRRARAEQASRTEELNEKAVNADILGKTMTAMKGNEERS